MVDFCVNDNQGNGCSFGVSVPENEVNLTDVLKCLGGLFKQVPGSDFVDMHSFSCNSTEGTRVWLPTDSDDDGEPTNRIAGDPFDNIDKCCPTLKGDGKIALILIAAVFFMILGVVLIYRVKILNNRVYEAETTPLFDVQRGPKTEFEDEGLNNGENKVVTSISG